MDSIPYLNKIKPSSGVKTGEIKVRCIIKLALEGALFPFNTRYSWQYSHVLFNRDPIYNRRSMTPLLPPPLLGSTQLQCKCHCHTTAQPRSLASQEGRWRWRRPWYPIS